MAAALPLAACTQRPRLLDVAWLGPDPTRAHQLREAPPQGPARERRADVLVLGAGVAGLSAARALRAAGREVTVLELDDAAGGNSRATELGGLPCPMGAHYLPQPGANLSELQDLLVEFGVAERRFGRWQAKDGHTVHAPAERRFDGREWQAGLLPPAANAAGAAEQRRFARLVREAQQRAGFALPTHRVTFGSAHRQLDAQTFDAWLDAEQLTEPGLRWYLDYCCRDDYGAGSGVVSAWAGLHYFASRHGFQAPDEDEGGDPAPPPFTAPQGNGWLTERLAEPLRREGHLLMARVGLSLFEEREGVELLCWTPEGLERWSARDLVLATPLFVAQRIWRNPPAALQSLRLPRAPWLVANLLLDGPPLERAGHSLAWDNVAQGSALLGYVNAQHQRLDPRPGPQVWTLYWALPQGQRPALLNETATHWAERVLQHLLPLHPDLRERLQQVRLTRWGHAMAVPAPGVRGQAALEALRSHRSRVRLAHADLAGYSVFEEAFMAGLAAAAR
ncbi:FAD-dependent oxidoreductase [Inhella sp.]|uniref:FAD-dependent oxidoreductase n=1 Tax=Inhella sp. TaxID=1921806 RepID=UPI0035B232C1